MPLRLTLDRYLGLPEQIDLTISEHALWFSSVIIKYNFLTPHIVFGDIFEVKLTFEMFTVRGQQHSFSTHERVLFWKCQSFETENVSTWEGLGSPTFGFMPNALTYWAIWA